MQIKKIMKYKCTYVRMAIIKIIMSVGEDVEKLKPLMVGKQNGHFGKQYGDSSKK